MNQDTFSALLHDNEALQVQLFNMSMPKLEDVILKFNDSEQGPQCNCGQCQYLGLIRESVSGETESRCRLWPAWDETLRMLNISVDHGVDATCMSLPISRLENGMFPLPVQGSPCRYGRNKTLNSYLLASERFWSDVDMRVSPACIVKFRDQWTTYMKVSASWGSPIQDLHDPRIEMLQKLWDVIASMDMPRNV